MLALIGKVFNSDDSTNEFKEAGTCIKCIKMKILSVFALIFGFISCTVAQSKANLCKSYIFIDALQRGILVREEPDTMTRKESEKYYLRVLLKSCKGSMYIERGLVANGNIVLVAAIRMLLSWIQFKVG